MLLTASAAIGGILYSIVIYELFIFKSLRSTVQALWNKLGVSGHSNLWGNEGKVCIAGYGGLLDRITFISNNRANNNYRANNTRYVRQIMMRYAS